MNPRTTRAQRLAMPLARDVVRDLAAEHGACIRPVQLRRTASLVRACYASARSVAYCNGRIPACIRSGLARGLKGLPLACSDLTAAFPAVRGRSQQVRSLAGRCVPVCDHHLRASMRAALTSARLTRRPSRRRAPGLESREHFRRPRGARPTRQAGRLRACRLHLRRLTEPLAARLIGREPPDHTWPGYPFPGTRGGATDDSGARAR